jgi:folate receptor
MWNDAFEYTPDTAGYSMWWFEGGTPGQADAYDNPNNLMAATLGKTVPTQCHLDYFHKDAPTPEGDDFTECHPWHANACCHNATVVSPVKLMESYGPGYEWDRCGPLSQACERFFVEEACFYECEPNAGNYRKYTDEQHAACSADGVADGATVTLASGGNYTCVPGAWGGNDENKWQLYKMPIKASYADSWFRACGHDLFCGNGDYFACAGKYHQHLEDEAAREAELALNATRLAAEQAAALAAASDSKSVPGWAIAVIVVSCAGLALLAVGTIMMYSAEKRGSPIFTSLDKVKSPKTSATASSSSAAANA